jgi:hypothetical protein
MSICPNGHSSESTDYCDVCGAPMAAPEPAAPEPDAAAASGGASLVCPNCSFPALPDALFCENCGYDFTTGSLPEPAGEDDPGAPSAAAPTTAGPVVSVESAATPPPAATPEAQNESGTAPIVSVGPDSIAPPPAGEDAWVAEVWVDPEWYEAQKAEDPLPSGGLPAIVVLRQRSVLVGRHSASRGIDPQIDCGTDSGVSRRQCQLNTDGQRWWVEDLQSSNGTFVSPAGEELPTVPITPGQRHEIDDGDRIFIGAWTRLVIRKALPGEV